MKKVCKYCLQEKDDAEFERKFGSSLSICKECSQDIRNNQQIKLLEYKICGSCFYKLPVMNFDLSNKTEDGYSNTCKVCKENKKKFKKVMLESYGDIICKNCNKIKEGKDFYIVNNKPFTEYCKECLNELTSYKNRKYEYKICEKCGEKKVACNKNFRISTYKESGYLRNTCWVCSREKR